jgi:glutamate dehydrogenase (NAD(P)+)
MTSAKLLEPKEPRKMEIQHFNTGNVVKDRQPILVVEWVDELLEARGWLVIDMLVNHVAGGGTRVKSGLTADEMIKLAQTMTLKFTLTDPHIGGAKCGLDIDPDRPDKLIVMQRFYDYIKPFLLSCYVTGPDLNTNEEEVIACTRSLGVSCPQYALAKSLGDEDRRVRRFFEGIHLPIDPQGKVLMNAAATGFSIYVSAKRALQPETLRGKRIAIQGFGNVGSSCAKFMADDGARIEAISDRFGTVYCESGLDIEYLLSCRDEKSKTVFQILQNLKDRPPNYELIADTGAIYQFGEDILIPAADSEIITNENYRSIKARYLVCGANDPFNPADIEDRMFAMGRVVIPDFIANAGTAALYHTLIKGEGPVTVPALLCILEKQIAKATDEALQKSKSEKVSPRLAAELLAEEKIKSYPESYVTALAKRWR